MIKTFCDRCGKEVERIQTIDVPQRVDDKFNSIHTEKSELCDSCYDFVNKAVNEYNNAMSKVRIEFYKALLPQRSDT